MLEKIGNTICPLMFHILVFSQAHSNTLGVSIYFGENNDKEFFLLNDIKKRGGNIFSSMKIVVNVYVLLESGKGDMKVGNESVTHVLASEVEEHVVVFMSGSREKG